MPILHEHLTLVSKTNRIILRIKIQLWMRFINQAHHSFKLIQQQSLFIYLAESTGYLRQLHCCYHNMVDLTAWFINNCIVDITTR